MINVVECELEFKSETEAIVWASVSDDLSVRTKLPVENLDYLNLNTGDCFTWDVQYKIASMTPEQAGRNHLMEKGWRKNISVFEFLTGRSK